MILPYFVEKKSNDLPADTKTSQRRRKNVLFLVLKTS